MAGAEVAKVLGVVKVGGEVGVEEQVAEETGRAMAVMGLEGVEMAREVAAAVWMGIQEMVKRDPEQEKQAAAAMAWVAAAKAPPAKVGAEVTAAPGSPRRYLDAPSQSSTRGRSARLGPPMSVQPAAP